MSSSRAKGLKSYSGSKIVNIQGGSNMTGTDLCVNKCKQPRSYLNHLVLHITVEGQCISGVAREYYKNNVHVTERWLPIRKVHSSNAGAGPATIRDGFRGFPRSLNGNLEATVSFHTPSSSLFTYHPTIRRCLMLAADSIVKQPANRISPYEIQSQVVFRNCIHPDDQINTVSLFLQ